MKSEVITDKFTQRTLNRFPHELHLKCIINDQRTVNNDNNNFAPSIFRSLCGFVFVCFVLFCFFVAVIFPRELRSLRKKKSSKQSPPISRNGLKKDGAQLSLSNHKIVSFPCDRARGRRSERTCKCVSARELEYPLAKL